MGKMKTTFLRVLTGVIVAVMVFPINAFATEIEETSTLVIDESAEVLEEDEGEELSQVAQVASVEAEKSKDNGIKLLTDSITTGTTQVEVEVRGSYKIGILRVIEYSTNETFDWNDKNNNCLGQIKRDDLKVGINKVDLTKKPTEGKNVVVALFAASIGQDMKLYTSDALTVEANKTELESNDRAEVKIISTVTSSSQQLVATVDMNFKATGGALAVFEYPENETFSWDNVGKKGYKQLGALPIKDVKKGENTVSLSSKPTPGKRVIAVLNIQRDGEFVQFYSNSVITKLEDYKAEISITSTDISADTQEVSIEAVYNGDKRASGSTALYAYPADIEKFDADNSKNVRLGTIAEPIEGSYTFKDVDLADCIGYKVIAVLRVPDPINPKEFKNYYSNEVVVTGTYQKVEPKIVILNSEIKEEQKYIELSMDYTRNLKPRFSIFAYPQGEEFKLGDNTTLLGYGLAEIVDSKRIELNKAPLANQNVMVILFIGAEQHKSNAVTVTKEKTNRPMVLLYNLSKDTSRGELLRNILDQLSIEYKELSKDTLNQKIGYIAELKGFEENPEKYTGAPYTDEFMIMSCLDEPVLDAFLAKMMDNGLRINHKAQVTNTNKDWTLEQLMCDIGNEHGVFQEVIKLGKLVEEAEKMTQEGFDPEKWTSFQKKLAEATDALKTHEPPIELLISAHDNLQNEILKLTDKKLVKGNVCLHCTQKDDLYDVTAEVVGGDENATYIYDWSNNLSTKTVSGIAKEDLRALKVEIRGDGNYYGKFPKAGLIVPDVVTGVSVQKQGDKLEISWNKNKLKDNMPAIDSYVVEVLDGDKLIKAETVSPEKNSLTVDGIDKDTTYLVKLFATNAVGRSDKVVFDNIQKHEEENYNRKSSRRRSGSSKLNSEAKEAISSSETQTPKVDVSRKPLIGVTFFEKLKENPKKTIVLSGEGYSWQFIGVDVDEKVPGLIYLDTTIERTSPNENQIRNLAGEKELLFVHFNHHGKLPAKAKITIDIPQKYRDKKLNVYYYNEGIKEFEPVKLGVDVINGKLEFEITHCSDYVITPHTLASYSSYRENPETGGVLSTTENSFEINHESSIATVILPIIFISAVVSIGASLYKRESQK